MPTLPGTSRGALRKNLARLLARPCTIVGLGNADCTDDGFGPALVAALRDRTCVPCIDCGTTPENFTTVVLRSAPACILFVDAGDLQAAPGTLRLCPIDALEHAPATTHTGSLSLLAQYWSARCGARCWALLAQPACGTFRPGAGCTPAVRNAVRRARNLILAAAPGTRKSAVS